MLLNKATKPIARPRSKQDNGDVIDLSFSGSEKVCSTRRADKGHRHSAPNIGVYDGEQYFTSLAYRAVIFVKSCRVWAMSKNNNFTRNP